MIIALIIKPELLCKKGLKRRVRYGQKRQGIPMYNILIRSQDLRIADYSGRPGFNRIKQGIHIVAEMQKIGLCG